MTQQKRNLRLLISLATLTVVTAAIAFIQLDANSDVDRNIFKVETLDQIDHIVLEGKDARVELTYNGIGWSLNNQDDADHQMITLLFATLENVKSKRPLPKSLSDSVYNQIITSGVSVSLYAENELITQFYAGGNSRKTESYFTFEKDIPYIVEIPGYRVYVNYVFEMPAYGWKDKRVFNFNWRNFKSLTTIFPGNPQAGFNIEMDNQFFNIKGVLNSDTTRINDFLDAVSLLEADENLPPQEIDTSVFFLKIKVEDIASRSISLNLYSSQESSSLVGKDDKNNFYRFNKNKIDLINRPKDYFKVK